MQDRGVQDRSALEPANALTDTSSFSFEGYKRLCAQGKTQLGGSRSVAGERAQAFVGPEVKKRLHERQQGLEVLNLEQA